MDKKLIGVFEAIQASFQLIQKNLALFLLIGIGGQVLLSLVGQIFLTQLSLGQLIIGGVLIFFLSVVVSSYISIATILMTFKAEKSEEFTFEGIFKEASPYFFKFLLLEILIGLTVIGGFILLIIPGIIFSVWFFASIFILFEQNKTGIEAMKASKNLVKGYSFEVFTRFLFGILLVILVSAILSAFIAPGDPNERPGLISSILQAILSGVLTVIGTVYSFVIYRSLQSVKTSK